jgi:TolB protein
VVEPFSPQQPIILTGGSVAADQNPLWSPDGSRLAFTTMRATGSYDIWMMNSDGSQPRSVVSLSGQDEVNLPGSAWCAHNDRIVFASDRVKGDAIWTMKADGTGAVQLTSGTTIDQEPSWSPTCDRITFMSKRDGNWAIYVMNADGSNVKALTSGTFEDWQPNWSPTSEQIVFQSNRVGQWTLWLVDATTGALTQMTTGQYEDTDASFSPDGKYLVYSTDEGGSAGARIALLSVAKPKTSPTLVTQGNAYDGAPSWSPDGRRIAFESDRTGNLDIWLVELY